MCNTSVMSYDPVIHIHTLRPLVEVSLPLWEINSQLFFFLTPSENAALVMVIQQLTYVNTGSYSPHSRGFKGWGGSKPAKDITWEVGVHLC